MLQMRLRPGLRRSPDPVVGPTPLGACGASTLTPWALANRRPSHHWLFDKSNADYGTTGVGCLQQPFGNNKCMINDHNWQQILTRLPTPNLIRMETWGP